MKRICVITRIRNDEFFAKKWISYYGPIFGNENLYIYLDGMDQDISSCDDGKVNIISCERINGVLVSAEKQRLAFLSDRAEELFKRYDLVIGVDVDEFLVVNPDLNMSLGEYLSSKDIKTCLSGLGVDVAQNTELEADINPDLPYLSQRSFAHLNSRYTKPVVLGKPLRWGSGFHRVKGHNFHIDPNLFLFHFGCFDYNMLVAKLKSNDLISAGWSRHLNKRTRTNRYVTEIKAIDGTRWMPIVRRIQQLCRPITAWNKPTVFGWKFIISIPEKFKNIL